MESVTINNNMKKHTKSNLLEMNRSSFGVNWIRNIDNIKDTELAYIYPTGDAGLSGRLYYAWPVNILLTKDDIVKYNIWL